MNDDVARQADVIAAQIRPAAGSYEQELPKFEAPWRELLTAVVRAHPGFAFDREGRPDAIAAIRRALPLMERELLDAVLEDHACELAAVREALFQVALAVTRAARPPGPPQG
jgi:hypothetical protein